MTIEDILKRYQKNSPKAFISKRGISVIKGGREVLLYGNRVAANAWLAVNQKEPTQEKVAESVKASIVQEQPQDVVAEPMVTEPVTKKPAKRGAKSE